MSTSHHSDSTLDAVERALRETAHHLLHTAEIAFRIPEAPRSRWHRAGVSPRTERLIDVAGGVILAALAVGWTWSAAVAGVSQRRAGVADLAASVAAALSNPSAPTAAYVTDAVMQRFSALRGRSGRLLADIRPAGDTLVSASLPAGTSLEFSSGLAAESAAAPLAPESPGVWSVAVRVGNAIKPLTNFRVITLKPFSDKERGRIGLYYLGNWPYERGRARQPRYANPAGFIEVTPENQNTYVSEHFRLRDFLTKDQPNVWPKYLVLDTKLLDKLELLLADLESRGVRTAGVRVMSGFRTPQYNASGGDPNGRSGISRHMYGDAADIFIDSDGNGTMDDLDGDGRVTIRDARVIEAATDRVERAHPALVGGVGVYPGTGSHGPFVHIDVRGYRARWLGEGGGS